MAKLTEKQKRFCDHYIVLGNATKASIEAGYSKKTSDRIGTENLAKPAIKAYINERLEKIASERIMTAQEILERLSMIASAKITETVIVGNAEGYSVAKKPPDFKTQIQAMKEILKRYRGDNKLIEQQIRKLTADADLAEIKANTIKGLSDDGSLITIVDGWLDDE